MSSDSADVPSCNRAARLIGVVEDREIAWLAHFSFRVGELQIAGGIYSRHRAQI